MTNLFVDWDTLHGGCVYAEYTRFGCFKMVGGTHQYSAARAPLRQQRKTKQGMRERRAGSKPTRAKHDAKYYALFARRYEPTSYSTCLNIKVPPLAKTATENRECPFRQNINQGQGARAFVRREVRVWGFVLAPCPYIYIYIGGGNFGPLSIRKQPTDSSRPLSLVLRKRSSHVHTYLPCCIIYMNEQYFEVPQCSRGPWVCRFLLV